LDQPTQFGPYTLLERISLGGMAEVFKAVEFGVDGFERTVAVKRILPHVAEDEEFIAMFKDEARIAVQLTHSNIAQIYNLGHEHDSFYIALEYVAGKDVRSIFERGRSQGQVMPIAQACFIVMRVCEGLDYAHNKKDKYGRHLNIIHRDVSPPNILVSYEGQVKLIDFGVAKAAGRASNTQAGILKGKFGYMSPEQVRGMPLDRRSDVFSLGVCLWEILTNTRLFQAETDFATLEKVRAVEVDAPSQHNPDVGEDLERIVFKALASEPAERYQSAMELHDELQAFMFAQGLFYSRKDLAAWMRRQYAKEIEVEKQKANQQAVVAKEQQQALRQRKTMMMSPGGGPPPPPGGGGRRPPPPPGKGRPPPPKPTGSRQSAIPTQAHRPVSANPAPSKPPPPGGGGRKRAKTMVMSTAKAPVPGGPPKPPGPPAPRPRAKTPVAEPASYDPPAGSSDFDWDDDELETRLFDGAEGEQMAESNRASDLASARMQPQVTEAQQAIPPTEAEARRQGAPARMPAPPGGGMTAPQKVVPPSSRPAPSSMPAPSGRVGGTAPQQVVSGGTAPSPVMPAPQPTPQAVPPQPSPVAGLDYDEPKKKSPLPLIIGIAAGVVIVGVGGFFGYKAISGGEEKPTEEAKEVAAAPAKEQGGLSIEVTPADAQITVDGNAVPGTGTPRVLQNLDAGTHKVAVSAGDSFLPFEQDVAVAAGVITPMPVSLQLKEVALTIEAEPRNAKLEILANGQPTAIKATHKLVREPGVAYKVQASARGYESMALPIVFTGEATQTVKIALPKEGQEAVAVADTPEPAPAPAPTPAPTPTAKKKKKPAKKKAPAKPKTATLKIGVMPGTPPATVYVDGRKVGSGPVVVTKVSGGSHTVKWKWSDGKTTSQKVSVGDTETKVVRGKK
jgi:serine/threonine-protein kinase